MRRVDGRRRQGFAVDQKMQQVQHVRLGRNAGLQRHIDGRKDGLFIVLKDERLSVVE